MHSSRAMVGALIFVVISVHAAAADTPKALPAQNSVGSQGRTWNSIKKLPDWSGVWVLADESWTEAAQAAEGEDGGRMPLTSRYLSIRAGNPLESGQENEHKCIPVGMPESTGIPIGHEYLFTPGRVTVIFENGIVRRIDTSGRPHPPEKDLNYSFAGNSIGHWEGATLVVDTIGLVSQAEFSFGLHVTEKTHLTERIIRKDRNTLQIDTVMTDPEIFTKPYAYTRIYKHYTGEPGESYPCSGTSRDVMVDGKQTGVDLTPPPVEKR
jgi:hypothetical protein